MAHANAGKAWTDEHIKLLKKLAKANRPTGIIAWELGRTETAVFAKASELGISLHPTNQSPYDRNFSNAKKKGK